MAIRKMKTSTISKGELLSELNSNSDLGIAYNQSSIILQTMDYREFLNWYADSTGTQLSLEETEHWDDDKEEYITAYAIVRRISGKVFGDPEHFDNEEDAKNEYYDALERRYMDDNGAGGIFYNNSEALARLQDDQDEWQELFEVKKYRIIQISGYTNANTCTLWFGGEIFTETSFNAEDFDHGDNAEKELDKCNAYIKKKEETEGWIEGYVTCWIDEHIEETEE
jgi:hypothetical protein